MKRRDFLTAAALAATLPALSARSAEKNDERIPRRHIETRLYRVATAEKRARLEAFLAEAMIPALKKLEIGPVGVLRFQQEGDFNLYVILPANSSVTLVDANGRMMADEAFRAAAAPFLTDAMADPLYQRLESSLHLAFTECPDVETPCDNPERVFQLRIYESHNIERARKKIAMFNEGGELAIFRDTGMNPVFFGETLIGDKMPNLTYMLGFTDDAAREKAWAAFQADPRWTALKNDEQYKDTVSNITNLMLTPADCSEI